MSYHHTEESKNSMKIAHTGKKLSAEHKAKISLSLMGNKRMLGKKLSPEWRAKMSASRSGVKNPNFGKHWKMSAAAKSKMSASRKGMKNTLGMHHSPETRAKMSQIHKLENMNTEFRDRRIGASRKALGQFPNNSETIIMNILDELYPNEWRYTGKDDFIIGGQNPDFVNVNGQKKIIEFFGDYWHTVRARKFKDTEQGRVELFRTYGFDTLIIWGRELKDIDTVKNKIKVFCAKEVCHG